jgi:GTPase
MNSQKDNLPVVAIVGRPNVGKSALFNRLARKQIAIVHDEPGVTRDRLVADCTLGLRPFTVVDTGGVDSLAGNEPEEQVRSEARLATELADVIVLVGDSQCGVTPIDRSLAKELRLTRKPVILAVNKIDHPKQEIGDLEFAALGFEDLVSVSAAHGRGIRELVESIESRLPTQPVAVDRALERPTEIKIAIIGRPNVGKSSLINAILNSARTIVSAVPGTTRDSVDISYERDGQHYILIDTAGIRHRRKVSASVEVFSVMRSAKSIARADICALVVDASEGVTAQDKKIAGLIQVNHKACVVIVNKVDLIKPSAGVRNFTHALIDQIRTHLFFLSYAPIDIVSAHTGENLERLFSSIAKIRKHAVRLIGTGELNRLLQEAMRVSPPPIRANKRFKLLYATQINNRSDAVISAPTFILFVNHPELLTDDYRRYIEARIRERNGYYGLPIVIRLRARTRKDEGRSRKDKGKTEQNRGGRGAGVELRREKRTKKRTK